MADAYSKIAILARESTSASPAHSSSVRQNIHSETAFLKNLIFSTGFKIIRHQISQRSQPPTPKRSRGIQMQTTCPSKCSYTPIFPHKNPHAMPQNDFYIFLPDILTSYVCKMQNPMSLKMSLFFKPRLLSPTEVATSPVP